MEGWALIFKLIYFILLFKLTYSKINFLCVVLLILVHVWIFVSTTIISVCYNVINQKFPQIIPIQSYLPIPVIDF